MTLLDRGLPDDARAEALAGLALAPDDAALLSVAGRAGVELGDPAAIGELRRVTQLRPDDGADWLALADALAMVGDNDEAARCFARAAELGPGDELSLAAAGAAAFAAGDAGGAVSHLAKAAAISTGASSAAINLVDVYRELGRLEDALAMARRVVQARPDELALLDAGELELAAGDPRAAIAAFVALRALLDTPAEAAAALHGVIEAQLAAGDAAGARATADEALMLDGHGRSRAIDAALESGALHDVAELAATSRADLRQAHAEDRLAGGGG